jgi:hypothetical protein
VSTFDELTALDVVIMSPVFGSPVSWQNEVHLKAVDMVTTAAEHVAAPALLRARHRVGPGFQPMWQGRPPTVAPDPRDFGIHTPRGAITGPCLTDAAPGAAPGELFR